MLGFFAFYLLLYGGLHFHFFLKVRAAFELHGLMLIPLGLWLLVVFLAPMVVWRLEAVGLHALVKPVAFISYCWMGFIFLFFTLSVSLDLLHLLLKGVGGLLSFAPPVIAARALLLLSLAVALLVSGWGFIAARTINVERVTVSLPRVPLAADGYRIVQLSDLHLGVMTNRQWLDDVIGTVNGLQPDLIVATGDIIDSHVDGSREFAEALQRLTARDGGYAILGNHEHYAGSERAVQFFHNAGLAPLVDESLRVRPWLVLVGADDRGHHGSSAVVRPERELPLLQHLRSQSGVVVLLKHQPVVAEGSLGLFDIQISGHVHQGQIYPFRYLTRLVYQAESGLTWLGQGSWLYLSRGTGTWGPPMRVLAPPEITLIELRHTPQ